MMYRPLPTIQLNSHTDYFHSGELPEVLHLNDPALDAMVDLKLTKAMIIHQDASIIEAEVEMRVLSIHFLLAVDNFDKIVGLISSEDILGTKPLQIIQDKPLTRENVKVHSIMIPCDKIVTINKDELKIAKVGHIIETLRQARQHYAFVVEVDPSNQKQTIVGLFSLSHISKQINKNLTDNNFIALSIAELHNKL